MKVELHLFATLAKYLPPGAEAKTAWINIPESARICDLMEELDIPSARVKLIFLNGVHADRQHPLKDGDRVGMFPPVGGG